VTTHHTPEGARHEGDEFDCVFCREALLEAFRAPVDTAPPGPPSTLPPQRRHLMVPPDRTRTVPFPDHSTWEVVRRTLTARTWEAGCACGWRQSGRFGLLTHDEALRLAQDWSAWHLAHPDATLDEEKAARDRRNAPHDTSVETESGPDGSGWVWTALCPCGWIKWGRCSAGESQARHIAEAWAENHRNNPLKEGD
jgi:hypothetical protein